MRDLGIIINDGMVNILGDKIFYGNIRGMYKGNRDGHGIQLDETLLNNQEEITQLCDEIAEKIYGLEELLRATQ